MLLLVFDAIFVLPYARSLKQKRAIRQSLIAHLKRNFSFSVRETDQQDRIQSLVIAGAFVCLSRGEGQQVLQKLEDFLYRFTLEKSCQLQHFSWDLLDSGDS